MDSIKVLFDSLQPESSSWLSIIKDFSPLLAALASIGGTIVAVYAIRKSNESRLADLRHNIELKELDLAEAERERKFHLQRVISERALEVLHKSYHLTHEINRIYNQAGPEISDARKQELWDRMGEVRQYWEQNMFYLPNPIRENVFLLTNALGSALQGGESVGRVQLRLFEKITEMFQKIEKSMNEFMNEYNFLYQADSLKSRE